MATAFESSARIDVSEESGTLILRIGGELDLASRPLVEPAVMAAIPTAYRVVLDLRDLTFCDSTGIAMFVAAHERAEAEGTTLVLGNLGAPVARVLGVTGVDQILNVTE